LRNLQLFCPTLMNGTQITRIERIIADSIPVIADLTRNPLNNARHCRIAIRRQAYPVNNPRIYPGVNVASPTMNAGGVTLLCMCKPPKGQRHPAFAEGKERRLPPDKSGGYSQDTPTGVSQCAPAISCTVVIPCAVVIPRLTRDDNGAVLLIRRLRVKPAMTG
jgi:hypothetical protein